ncbi:hypothetical protein NO995_00330 [Aestuariibaculum sp. M13]|uniref:vanadium-dependent haloperoxidase n=1 Tax=Aestuariibaculum sp. M13 TaxID=2967132 RepID=UPI002159E3FC|nr:vanadium-dependent haloperoxidase [Aestuariibaculum sp. M13]MCR8666115.1 hypothetical protein [Aestuariibaculum sp. M13]
MKTTWVATRNARQIKTGYILLIAILLLDFSCSKNNDLELIEEENVMMSKSANTSPNTVLAWNQVMEDLYTFSLNGPGTPPPSASYTWALVHLAMHDALNCIVPRYETYAGVPRDKDANPDAAVSQAAYDVLMAINQLPFAPAYLPQNFQSINALLAETLDGIPDGEAKNKGIALGHAVAEAIMAKRAGDTPNLAPGVPNQPAEGTQPGEYRYLPYPLAPNGMGYALANFHKLKPFFMVTNDMFRSEPPYETSSPEYAADLNETKDFGALNSQVRSADQTELGVFWAENSSRGWNVVARIVRDSYNEKSQNAWKTARYLALVHSAIADSYISIFESKMYHYFWRPITAIQLADNDGNDSTTADPSWVPLLNTPPLGEYPSAHAISGSVAGQVIIRFFDDRDNYELNLDSGYMPGVIRSFSSVSDAVRENSLSRIYIGYHFRLAVDVGEALGKELGDYVYENALKEK